MELAAIITTLVVVLLQIITLSHVLGTRKMISELGRRSQTPHLMVKEGAGIPAQQKEFTG